jgi:hypothetical protein
MPKYTVRIWVNREYTLDVEADDEEAAETAADDILNECEDTSVYMTESLVDEVFVELIPDIVVARS